jgi:signal-transduction protein with cAMP-binding, CBS, and nucleotidyltransferase domain
VVQETPMSEIHFMFTMLRASHLFVTHMGRLVGVIPLKDLLKDAVS